MDGIPPRPEGAVEQPFSVATEPLRQGNASRLWAPEGTPSRPTDPWSVDPSSGPPRSPRSSAATTGLKIAPGRPGCDTASQITVTAPSPDTVVTPSLRCVIAVEEQARLREATLRAGYASKLTRLTNALRAERRAHAAAIERLRAEHAVGLRQVVEAQWRSRDAARTAMVSPSEIEQRALPGPPVRSPTLPPGTRKWLARIIGWG